MLSKVSVIGAGNVGATCAQRILEKGFADVVLVDIVQVMTGRVFCKSVEFCKAFSGIFQPELYLGVWTGCEGQPAVF